MSDMNLKNYKNKINSLISKAQENAVKPLADKLLAFISLIESIIFPIPVDPLLAGLTLAAPHKTFRFALVCTIGSVVGGIVGWLLGFLMGPSIENIFMHIPWFTEEKFIAVKNAYKQNGMLIIFLGAFTPLPYKIITITSGVAGVNIFAFILILSFIILDFFLYETNLFIVSLSTLCNRKAKVNIKHLTRNEPII